MTGAARRIVAGAAFLALAAALAACGGGESPGRGVLGVGAVLPLSGPDGRTGEQVMVGLELACDEDGPGPLATLRSVDGAGKPLESSAGFQELARDPEIQVVIGGWFGSTARSIEAIAGTTAGDGAGLPFLALSPLAAARETPPTCFPLHRIDVLAAAAAVYARDDLGAKNVGVARRADSEIGRLLAEAFVAEASGGGTRIVWDVTVEPEGEVRMPPGPERQVDAIYVAGPGDLASKISSHSARTRSAAILTADGWSRTGLLELADDGVAVYLVSTYSGTDPSPASRSLLEVCAQAGRDPNPALALGWDAGRLVRHAAARGGPTREGILAALRSGAPFAGATGRIEFPAGGGEGSETPAVSSFGRAGVVFLKRVDVAAAAVSGGG